ncbi:bis(5'-nucleosyl)-tetraphosphatase (symmetrical) YqeK [Paenibacillus guangzhouensis]|uniref:bis(5'-nucleosyl)-tetraphosphatase (symmetrical) YqeK n=1 Tax=Paenibacillus guangzhouensis TaxID=1473112 RepID=UPI001266E065|nr:bis(5'-nucleosyl)-tetraphosphatase (symmetrical) YqeK [Paenibacillus guangzhouensis]
MNFVLLPFIEGLHFTGDLLQDITHFFQMNDDLRTLEHTLQVAAEAERIAKLYGVDSEKVIQAALLHDISNVIPISAMLDAAEGLELEILDDERKYNRSVHQKLSSCMARELFGVTDSEILAAIESHTTHQANASVVAKILFVSDKISWNLPGDHPHLVEMRRHVDAHDMDRAILVYLNQIWEQRHKLKLVHPWLIEAREELLGKITDHKETL